MQLFAFTSFAATCVLGAALSVRLLWVWRRTRQLPELALGVASLCLSASPIALISASALAGRLPSTAQGLFVLGVLLHPINAVAMAVGVARIFRPGARAAAGACVVVALLLAVWTLRRLAAGELALQTSDPLTAGISHAVRAGTYLWAAFECFRYRRLLQRRAALGMGDPEVAHRILLWGLSASCLVALSAITWIGSAFVGRPLLQWPPGLIAVNGLGLVAAAALFVAFFPPRFYRARVLGTADRPPATNGPAQSG